MFGIGETELLIIVAFGFMVFGPDKLPGMGRTIGRALRQFREAQEGFTEVVQTEVMDPLQEAMSDPLEGGTRKRRRATAEERAAALAQDADLEADGAQTARKETFAERKARLAAEREAREAAELAAAQAADADAPVGAEAPAAEEPVAVEGPAEPAAADTSAAALYSLGGSSSFKASKQREAEEAEKAAAAPEPEPASTTERKEAGEQQA